MPLPKVNAPTFELKLLSNSKTVKYRPFLVKEEKSLLVALENGNDKDVVATVKEVLKSCIITRGIKVDDLPSFDLEYLFQWRLKCCLVPDHNLLAIHSKD